MKEQKPAPVQQVSAPEIKPPDTAAQKQAEPVVRTEPAAKPARDTAAVSAPRKFAVQAGAFSSERKAQKQVDFFSTINRKAIVTSKISAGKNLYVVSIEDFTNEQDARDFIAELKLKYNIESIIVAR